VIVPVADARRCAGAEAATAVTLLFGNPCGRPPGSLRGSRSWFSLLAHTHLLVISHSFSSQFGVQENPRARDFFLGTSIAWARDYFHNASLNEKASKIGKRNQYRVIKPFVGRYGYSYPTVTLRIAKFLFYEHSYTVPY
jgi:hypothetical protein